MEGNKVKIVLIGGLTGKTAILERYIRDEFTGVHDVC
jgi:GTPase SAR1 family protein